MSIADTRVNVFHAQRARKLRRKGVRVRFAYWRNGHCLYRRAEVNAEITRAWHVEIKDKTCLAFNDTNPALREIPFAVAELMYENPQHGAEILDMYEQKDTPK